MYPSLEVSHITGISTSLINNSASTLGDIFNKYYLNNIHEEKLHDLNNNLNSRLTAISILGGAEI